MDILNAGVNDGLSEINPTLLIPLNKIKDKNVSSTKPNKINIIPALESFIEKNIRLRDLNDIKTLLDKNKSVDRGTVATINDFIPGLINNRVSIEEFSLTPTKVNYAYVVSHVAKGIAIEEAKIVEGNLEVLTTELANLQVTGGTLADEHIRSVINDLNDIIANNSSLLEALKTNVDTIFPCDSKSDGNRFFINIATANISDLAEVHIVCNIKSSVFNNLSVKLNECVSSTPFITLLYLIKHGMSLNEFYSTPEHEETAIAEYRGLTLQGLVKLFKDDGLITTLTSFGPYFNEKCDVLDSFIKSQGPFTDEELSKFKYNISPATSIVDMFTKLKEVSSTVSELFKTLSALVI